MGDKITMVIGWMLALVLAYLFLTHGTAVTSIAGTTFTGSANVLKVLQGR